MLKTNLKIAWRHLIRDKYISTINFIGLVVGMVAVLFIWQYVDFEKSYDEFHENSENIYRIRTDRVKDGETFMQFAAGAACAGPVIKKNFPEVENYVKLYDSGQAIFKNKQERNFQPEKVFYTMPSFFDVFSFPLIEGDPKTCLKEPFTACISETTARKIFGEESALGKTIIRNDQDVYTVTGILKDAPQNSHLKFDILLSYITFSDVFNEGNNTETAPYWDGFLTYLQLKPQVDWKELESKIPEVIETTYDQEARESVVFYLQPFEDIHLTSNFLFETESPGDGSSVNFLLIIGFLVLIIAWFNYVNLSTARSELRAQEVGVRKVLGSGRGALIRQFLTEAVIMNIAAFIMAIGLTQILHPWFSIFIDQAIPMSLLGKPKLLASVFGVFVLGTFLTGLYPAFLLSSFKPVSVLKSGFGINNVGGGNWLRRGLVVFQFIASVGLIAATLIIYNQLNFMQETELGVDIDQTLVIKRPIVIDSTYIEKSKTFRKEVEQLAAIKSVTGSTSVPGQPFGWTAGITLVGNDNRVGLHAIAADYNFTEAYDISFVAGRAMKEEMGNEEASCILNEKGVEVFKFESPEAALGARIDFWGEHMRVIGVVNDFHQESPKSIIEPMILREIGDDFTPEYFSLKLSTFKLGETIDDIEKIWGKFFIKNPIDFFFLDEHYNQQYKSDRLFGKIFSMFSGLAIFVSCLGLLALIAFVAERRKKEIGIRKVIGASISNIVMMLSKDFLQLIVVALVIAVPLCWMSMNNWLNGFAQRIEIQWWTFVLAGVLVAAIALLTMSLQSVKAARANPVESLRSE